MTVSPATAAVPPTTGIARQPSDFLKKIVQTDFPMLPFDRIGKLPVFYYDNTSMTAVFTAATRKVKALLPDSKMRPLELLPGRCAVAFSAFEYRDTDIDPYNEFSIAFLISYDRHTLPGLGLLRGLMNRCFEAYVWQLPVTTEIARWGGVELYGYPKFTADIDFTRTSNQLTCRLALSGQHILTLNGSMPRTAPAKTLRYRAYSMKDRQPLCANVYTNRLEFTQSVFPKAVALQLGDHEIAQQLRELNLSKSPLVYQYCPKNELILFGPRNLIDN
jgi:hypothetical protein